MTVYSYEYFKNLAETNINYYHVFYAIAGVAFVILLFLRLRSHIAGRHRDLLIIIGLSFFIISGIQYSNYTNGKTSTNNAKNMITFLDSVSDNLHSNINNVYVNQTSMKEGMVIKVNDKFYKVTFNNDYSSYLLDETYLLQRGELDIKWIIMKRS